MRSARALAWSIGRSLRVRLAVALTLASALQLAGVTLGTGYEPTVKTMLPLLVLTVVASWLVAGRLALPSPSPKPGADVDAFPDPQPAAVSPERTSQAGPDGATVLVQWAAALEQRARGIGVLNELVAVLHGCRTPQAVYQAVSLTMPRLFPGSSGLLYGADATSSLQPEATWGEGLAPARLDAVECYALQLGLPYIREPGRPACAHAATTPAGSSMCVPLAVSSEARGPSSDGRAFSGLLYVTGAWGPREQEDLRQLARDLALAAAQHVALAVANLQLREGLLYLATRDPLTKLYNRRYLEDAFERELSRSTRSGASLSVVMLDLDHFKQFNDTFGHREGDRLLAALGELLLTAARREDIACRYGGEEFVVVLPQTDAAEAQHWAERVGCLVRDLDLSGACRAPVTCSAGVATYPDHGATAETVLQAADEALYAAKRDGRDRVVLAGVSAAAPTLLRRRPQPMAGLRQGG